MIRTSFSHGLISPTIRLGYGGFFRHEPYFSITQTGNGEDGDEEGNGRSGNVYWAPIVLDDTLTALALIEC